MMGEFMGRSLNAFEHSRRVGRSWFERTQGDKQLQMHSIQELTNRNHTDEEKLA